MDESAKVTVDTGAQQPAYLQPGDVAVWYAEVSQMSLDVAACWPLLDVLEQTRARQFTRPEQQQWYVCVRAVSRRLLGYYLQESPAALRIERTPQGKPLLPDFPALRFNLSHSGNHLLFGLTLNRPIGVDIEQLEPRRQLRALVNRCFAPEEQAYWRALPDAEQMRAFFAFWTRKEALVKATGQGLQLGLQRCVLDPQRPKRFLRLPEACGDVADWQALALAVDDSCCAAVVVQGEVVAVSYRHLDACWGRFM